MTISLQSRARGAMVGLAVGDALGAPIEFGERGTIVTDYMDTGPWKIPIGGWTDDTAQALCLAEGILADATLEQQMDIFVKWLTEGHNSCTGKAVGIGGTTLKSLMTYRVTGQIKPPTDEHSAGNGCIMRLAPVVIHGAAHDDRTMHQIVDECRESCKLTHGAPVAIECTALFGTMLVDTLDGCTKTEIRHSGDWLNLGNEFDHIINGEYRNKTESSTRSYSFGGVEHIEHDLKPSGYCVDTLECALWAFYHTDTFEDGMTKVLSLGGDADTIGAVYGQLAGAHYGYEAIPQRWRDGLVWHDKIVDLADKLSA